MNIEIIGVKIKADGLDRLEFCKANGIQLLKGDLCIIGRENDEDILGEVIQPPHYLCPNCLKPDLKEVLRKATLEDESIFEKKQKRNAEAEVICQEKITMHHLPMKLVAVRYNQDGSKIIFYFTAEGRVDFRELVKDLAQEFRTRIELKQIGVRDEAKLLTGLGPCGRPLCCSTFLQSFEPVSIKLAKKQKLSLNPAKISGICGRLMCCLSYEVRKEKEKGKGKNK